MTHEDKRYLESLQTVTGRDVQFGNFKCDLCGGLGFSTYEPICTQCYGDGFTTDPYFTDCECRVDKDDNDDCESCFPEELEEVSAAA